jgi:hypothetical protein
MIVKIEIRGDKAYVSGPPDSGFASFEESATRLRRRFAEAAYQTGDLVGYFDADTAVLGASTKPEDKSIQPQIAEVFEIKNRVYPKEKQRW